MNLDHDEFYAMKIVSKLLKRDIDMSLMRVYGLGIKYAYNII